TTAIYALLDAKPDVTDPAATTPAAPEALVPEVRFEDVHFGYASRRAEALRGVTFTLEAGRTLGVVGPSGAGKSTLVWLLLRFFDPGAGRLLIGGRDIRELPLRDLREMIAVVTQDTYLFYGTVAENLSIARPGASMAEVEAAARAANAHDFI